MVFCGMMLCFIIIIWLPPVVICLSKYVTSYVTDVYVLVSKVLNRKLRCGV